MLSSDVVSSAEKRIGETICGKWRLDRVIGIGGMAAVYEATHRNRNRVAIKLLHPILSLDEGTRRRFLREGYVANTIRHSGAVQILDDDTTEDGVVFLVMELLCGESVEERMVRKGGALEIHEALRIADQLLDVLGSAHDQKVVHRDIKPENIFLQDDGEIKVLDFGIARLHQGESRLTKVGSFMGTPAFCAQEQARGRWDEVDHRTDLYSVGATLFTCLSGTHVHEAETSSEQLALAISATARSLADVLPGAPVELVELVDTALAYDKEDRYQSARAMRAAVQRVEAGLPQQMRRVERAFPPNSDQELDESTSDELLPSVYPMWPSGKRILQLALVVSFLTGLLVFLMNRQDPNKTTDTSVEASNISLRAAPPLHVPEAPATTLSPHFIPEQEKSAGNIDPLLSGSKAAPVASATPRTNATGPTRLRSEKTPKSATVVAISPRSGKPRPAPSVSFPAARSRQKAPSSRQNTLHEDEGMFASQK